jgi:hypothetical protein
MNPASITRELHKVFPGVSISTRRHPVLPRKYIIAMPWRTASTLRLAEQHEDASRAKGSETLSRWLGCPVWVFEIRLMRPRITRPARYEITITELTPDEVL